MAVDSFINIGPSSRLRSASSRHHITLRSRRDQHSYHSLLLFSFPKPKAEFYDAKDSPFYCMEATCPHLGAPLENASIYDTEDEDDIEDAVIVCPWHEYDFSLRTGESSTGLKTCVYAVEEREGEVWIQQPLTEKSSDGSDHLGWDIVEVRPVSEAFCNGREFAAKQLDTAVSKVFIDQAEEASEKPSINLGGLAALPQTLIEWAVLVLNTPDPTLKVQYTRQASRAFRSGQCTRIGGGHFSVDIEGDRRWLVKEQESPPDVPPRLSTAKVVMPGREGRRGKGGSEKSRIAMLHSLANIEQWAIDLAWDIIARAPRLYAKLSPTIPLPMQFFSDFVKVAEDEAKHFSLLCGRLEDMGTHFGQLPVHHGLWQSASETQESLLARLSIIHLVHEARGLDANPLTIKKFENAGDKESVEALTIIHLDEVTHVSAGHRWLSFICEYMSPKQRPVDVFRTNVRTHFAGKLKGPFNAEDRSKAGLTKEWYEELVGEKHTIVGVEREEIPGG